jgi:hypothetical protein
MVLLTIPFSGIFCPEDGSCIFLEISVEFQRTTRRYIPEETSFYNVRCNNLNSCMRGEYAQMLAEMSLIQAFMSSDCSECLGTLLPVEYFKFMIDETGPNRASTVVLL